jgi:hypothetical protein
MAWPGSTSNGISTSLPSVRGANVVNLTRQWVSCPVGNGLGAVDLEFGIGTDTDQAW